MTTSMSKIEPRHLRLQAVVYIRQSTPQQIQNNQESTRRQYDLACRARQMGWPETAIRVIDVVGPRRSADRQASRLTIATAC